MSRLSRSAATIKPSYDVIVVGSGYGGSISASRLSRAGLNVCVLERGKEFQPGEYPDTTNEAVGEMQTDGPQGHIGPRTGLYDFRMNDDLNVFLGCGLGGTSLVNANVSLQADPRVFDDLVWPTELRQDVPTLLQSCYQHVLDMLKPSPYPKPTSGLRKLQAMADSAVAVNGPFSHPPINVNFTVNGPNHVGVTQQPCTDCGDCVTGCNYAAKNTVLMNYLPDAVNHGAEIFTKMSVRFIERKNNRWNVHYQLLDSGQERFDAPTLFVTADTVILSAGALGSSEILLRSKERGLKMSDQVGQHFSGNGDVLAFAYNNQSQIDGVGYGHDPVKADQPCGPCITGLIDLRNTPQLDDGMVIEEGSIPGGMANLLPLGMQGVARAFGRETATGLQDRARAASREVESFFGGAHVGAVNHTQTYLVMSHDGAQGELKLKNDRLRVDWPNVGKRPSFKAIDERLFAVTQPLRGVFVNNPIWAEAFGRRLITVHVLGGAVMANDAASGVVNHKGQVFSRATGKSVYDGLYVADGAIIPRSLGVNPLLTISAVAERNALLLAQDKGLAVDYTFPFAAGRTAPAPPPPAPTMGLSFTETMKGFVSDKATNDYAVAEVRGKQDQSPFQFTMTIVSDDLSELLDTPGHTARMTGTATAPKLSKKPMTCANGRFQLFVVDPGQPESRQMRYEMPLVAEDGKKFFLEGFKQVHNDNRFDLYADTTTLFVTIYKGDDNTGARWGRGILHIQPQDLMVQMTTMQVTNAANYWERLAATARFGQFFAGVVFETYGGVTSGLHLFDPNAPARKKRPLHVGNVVPEVRFFNTADGTQLRLTRYRGGPKGPVILAHGLGVASSIFSTDTIDTNMVEFLVANEYDVWLLDFRASIDLPVSSAQFDADVIATQDYPAAVDAVRAATGKDTVQMVVHCFGSTTFFMAMLAGLKHVRSIVCSQIATQVRTPPATQFKSALYLPDTLRWAGVTSLTALAQVGEKWYERVFDEALRLYPVTAGQTCQSATCHRITFMYSELYRHEQLNTLTHETLHEMFGVGNIRAFDHLTKIVRAGHLVGFDGSERYMPHLDRLDLPICFIHGGKNECFLPISTQLTMDELVSANGAANYRRHVIPGYGHIDCIFGKNAVNDVFPIIVDHLDATA